MSSRPGSRLFTIRYCSEFPPHLKTTGLLALGTDLLLPNWQCFRLLKCHFQSSGAGSVVLYYWSICIPRIPRGGCLAIFFFFFLTFCQEAPNTGTSVGLFHIQVSWCYTADQEPPCGPCCPQTEMQGAAVDTVGDGVKDGWISQQCFFCECASVSVYT